MTAVEEFYLLEVERARDRAKPRHAYDTHCLCYACEDTKADLVDALEARAEHEEWALTRGGYWIDDED